MKVISLVSVILFVITAWATPQVSINKKNQVRSAIRIHLKDIAEIKNVEGEKAQLLGQLDLGVAPAVGQTIKLSGAQLTKQLRKHLGKYETQWHEKIVLSVPAQVEIFRSKMQIDEAAVKKEISNLYAKICNECEFQISNLQIPWVADADGDSQWRIEANPTSIPRGSFSLPFKVEIAGQTKNYWVNGKIQVYKSVPVASRALNMNDRIQVGDYESQKREVTFADDSTFTSQQLIGKKLSRGVRVNDIIWKRDIAKELAIKQGQAVKVLSENDWYQITLNGVAQEKGEVGDTIRVLNTSTNTVIHAVVEDAGVVRVR